MTLSFTTAGESHGPAVIATLFGLPFGHSLDTALINAQLKRRQTLRLMIAHVIDDDGYCRRFICLECSHRQEQRAEENASH